VSKPLRPDELYGAIERLCVLPVDGRAADSDVPSAAPLPGPSSSTRLLDVPALLAGFGGNRKLLREVIDVFLVDGSTLMTAILQAADARDSDALAFAAHALKGSIGLFAQRGAYRTTQRLEQMARSGDLSGVGEACAGLEAEMAALRAALEDVRVSCIGSV
jgi:HPt (histidine-containing phosphotransfer) domain-containing protein